LINVIIEKENQKVTQEKDLVRFSDLEEIKKIVE
jgi:hypothetical protein